MAGAPLLRLDGTGVTLEALKKSEDGAGMVVRLWETHGRATEAVLHLPAGIKEAQIVNLLEQKGVAVAITGNAVRLSLAPFQILTLKLNS